MDKTTERRFNLAFNVFLVTGMIVAVTITTIFKLQQPQVKTFMLLLAAFGSVMGVINTVLSANGHLLTFLFGLLDVLAATVVLYDNGIMGNFALHALYFLPMQFVGFWQWRKRGAKVGGEKDQTTLVKARRLSARQWIWLVCGILAGIAVTYGILYYVDITQFDAGKITSFNKSKILLDAVVMTLNISGQVLLSFAFMEQWYIWILVNISSISLWAVALWSGSGSGNAAVMLIKYIFYLLNSLNGLRIWLNLCKNTASGDSLSPDLEN
ncbi:MAG: nicotinamide mononucleotide transporter [Bacteroidales bacterium]|nr:nicotinamide mononucleotide transporter [Bacteroidales bacterium]